MGQSPVERVLSGPVCAALLHLLESVITLQGATGKLAAIPGYRIAGKTGTAWKAEGGGYSQNRYVGVVRRRRAGEQSEAGRRSGDRRANAGKYCGGDVAAPVFSAVVGGALRLLGVPPDASMVPAGARGGRLGRASGAPMSTHDSRSESPWRPLKALLGGAIEVPDDVEVPT